MAKIFISYSRVDTEFLNELIPHLKRVFPKDDFWYDQYITGGSDWWKHIVGEIQAADIFIYLISNKSLKSLYCQAELRVALQLEKLIVPVVIRAKVNFRQLPDDLEPEIGRRNRVDMSGGVKDSKANVELFAAVNEQLGQIPLERPDVLAFDPPPPPLVPDKPQKSLTQNQIITYIGLILAAIGIVITLLQLVVAIMDQNPSPTSVANSSTNTPTLATLTAETATPTLEIVYIVATLDAQATIDQMTQFARDTAAARGTEIAIGTQSAVNGTATATLWTATPTANVTASIEAFYTQRAQTATAQFFIDASATVAAYTDTPTPTATPSSTPTETPSSTPTITPTATLTPLEQALQNAQNFSGTNTDWQPFEQNFDGVTMVLVPTGCFTIGSEGGWDDERNGNEICFDTPFWIDKYEVSNAQFASFAGAAASASNWTEPNRPRERITWFEARDFCASRDARLPTEAEWEYAARGPSNWIYPWGDEFVAENVGYGDNFSSQTADVGSLVGGASWVGAFDLSGNLWEWTSSIYQPYPYNPDDGREVDSNSTDVLRVLRGGSWNSTTIVLRSSNRFRYVSDGRFFDLSVGFRCLRP